MAVWITWSGRERSSQTQYCQCRGSGSSTLLHPIDKSLFSLVFTFLDGDLLHTKALMSRTKTNEYVILSIEPTNLGGYWVISYQDPQGITGQESIQALDSYEASIKFRNQKIQESKANLIQKAQK